MPQWQGKSKGTPLGYRIFIFVLKNFGLAPSYFLLRFVAFYFFLFSRNSSRVIYSYFRYRHKLSKTTSILKVYKNNYLLGQTLIDKVVAFAGAKNSFTYNFDGQENLEQMGALGRGGIMLSAHVGNWEMAGHHLENIKQKINIVMFDGEHQNIKKYLDEVGEKSFNVIVVKNDMSHVYAIGAALANNELVCMHADRYLDGNKTIGINFLGKEALFPAGPFSLAAGFNVPVSIVFAFKETARHYHYFGTTLLQKSENESKFDFAQRLAATYVGELENKLAKYPEQWFNYYDFWKS